MAKANSTSPRTSTERPSHPAAAENPHFSHADRAPFEIGRLLLDLPRYASQIDSKDGVQQAAAAVRHAENARNTLLYGLEALGNCLFTSATNDDYELNRNHVGNLGCLVRHISAELQMLEGLIDEFSGVGGREPSTDERSRGQQQ